ncbi:hypothetical protein [Nocardioides sp. Root190]|uniref:hypothetical protein n=1 Tax=Nocardioides sp. Root190 TaxID=1736488 RepID=UPI000B1B15CD|nr:hypothetical protein [Nocardioides sp. Root190]
MDADRLRDFADVDDALFDATEVPLTTRDIRTVGELLHDVDDTARRLLMDVAGEDAGRLLQAWPGLVTAAASVWSSLPGQGFGAGARTRDEPITRLVSLADTITKKLRHSSWPPASPPDPRIAQMTQTLGHAGDLVHRYGPDIPIQRADTFRDLEAARARIIHALYLSAHAVGVSLHQHGHNLYAEALGTDRPVALNPLQSPYAVASTTAWIHRMAVSEAAAGRYLDGRFTRAIAGEVRPPIEDDARIARALAGWDIQAHRTLASDAWNTNMVLITRTQGLIAGAAIVILEAAQLAGHIRSTDRLTPAIAEAGQAWSNLASRWGDLTAPDARLDPDLMRAAAEVRAALRELTHDTTTLASLNTIATRPGLELAATAALHAHESASELAYVIADKAEAPNLTGPARELSIRAHNEAEADLTSPGEDVVWVSPDDIRARRIVPAPQPVIDGLRRASLSTVHACTTAASVCVAHYKAPHTGVLQHASGARVRAPEEPPSGERVPAERRRGR